MLQGTDQSETSIFEFQLQGNGVLMTVWWLSQSQSSLSPLREILVQSKNITFKKKFTVSPKSLNAFHSPFQQMVRSAKCLFCKKSVRQNVRRQNIGVPFWAVLPQYQFIILTGLKPHRVGSSRSNRRIEA